MKTKISIGFLVILMCCISCDTDSISLYPGGGAPESNSFLINGIVMDSDTMQGVENIKILMKPEGIRDTLERYSDSTGVFVFRFNRNYGDFAKFMFHDTTGVYADFDTLLYFSGRDFNNGVRELFVNL